MDVGPVVVAWLAALTGNLGLAGSCDGELVTIMVMLEGRSGRPEFATTSYEQLFSFLRS